MGNKNSLVLVAVVLVAMFAFKYMQKQMIPYISFAEAMSKGEYVQIIGMIDRAKGITVEKNGLRFTIVDSKGTIQIVYDGVKPQYIEDAEKVVVIGKFDRISKVFRADTILTKCPSKYEQRKIK